MIAHPDEFTTIEVIKPSFTASRNHLKIMLREAVFVLKVVSFAFRIILGASS